MTVIVKNIAYNLQYIPRLDPGNNLDKEGGRSDKEQLTLDIHKSAQLDLIGVMVLAMNRRCTKYKIK